MNIKALRISLASLSLLVGVGVHAHHSVPVNYDMNTDIEIQGLIKAINFRNPHSSIFLMVTTDDGETVQWLVEMSAKNALIRRDFNLDQFTIGSELKVTGWKGKRERTVYFRKGTLVDGTEILSEKLPGTHVD